MKAGIAMDRHSLIVRVLIFALPLLAVAILVFAFTFDWSGQENITAQFDQNDAQFSDLYGQIDAPRVNATNSNGDRLVVNAQTARQIAESQNLIEADDITGEILSGGSNWDVQSDNGETDTGGKFAKFRGNVAALVDEKYNLLGSILEANIAERVFSSDEPITITSDRFDISADKGELSGERGKRVVVFTGNVKGVIRLENWK